MSTNYKFMQLWFKQPPYKGKSTNAIIQLVMNSERPAFKGDPNQGPAPPSVLGNLIEACWAHKNKDRPKVKTVLSTFEEKVEPAVAAFKGVIGPTDGSDEASDPIIASDPPSNPLVLP